MFEGRAIGGVGPPTIYKDLIVDGVGTERRTGQQGLNRLVSLFNGTIHLEMGVRLLEVQDHLLVCQVGVGLLLALGEDLPHGHAECPYVGSRREFTLELSFRSLLQSLNYHKKCLGSHPPQRKESPALDPIVVARVQRPRHPEVGDFNISLVVNKTIPGSDIPRADYYDRARTTNLCTKEQDSK